MIVAGHGPQPAAGMIVGEAPGKKETETGYPFMGSAGRELDNVLRALGVKREEIYITNVVKVHPLDSDGRTRRPLVTEVQEWLPLLAEEIAQTAPEAILALGRTAVNALTEIEGEKVPFGSIVGNVYCALHPAYFLHGAKDYTREEWLEQIRPWAEALGKFEYPS